MSYDHSWQEFGLGRDLTHNFGRTQATAALIHCKTPCGVVLDAAGNELLRVCQECGGRFVPGQPFREGIVFTVNYDRILP